MTARVAITTVEPERVDTQRWRDPIGRGNRLKPGFVKVRILPPAPVEETRCRGGEQAADRILAPAVESPLRLFAGL